MNIIEHFNSTFCIRLIVSQAHFLWCGSAIAILTLLAANLFSKKFSYARYIFYVMTLAIIISAAALLSEAKAEPGQKTKVNDGCVTTCKSKNKEITSIIDGTESVGQFIETISPGCLVDCLRDNPEIRPILLKAFSKNHFYSPFAFNTYSPDRGNWPELNKRLVAEFIPQLGIENSIIDVLLTDKRAAVRRNALKLLVWLDRQKTSFKGPVNQQDYFSWRSRLLDGLMKDTDNAIAKDALKHAFHIKAAVSIEAIKNVTAYGMRKCIILAALSHDRNGAIIFLLNVIENKTNPLAMRQLENIVRNMEQLDPQLFETILKIASNENIDVHFSIDLFILLKRVDRARITEYLLSIILDKDNEHLSNKSGSLFSRAMCAVTISAHTEDIPKLIEAHKKSYHFRQFDGIGDALINAGDEQYIRSVLEDMINRDGSRVLQDVRKGRPTAFQAIQILKYALRTTKPQWAYDLIEKAALNLNCKVRSGIADIFVNHNLLQGLPILEKMVQMEPDPHMRRNFQRCHWQLRINTKQEGRYLAIKDEDPYVVIIGLDAFREKPDKKVLADITTLTNHTEQKVAEQAQRTLNRWKSTIHIKTKTP